jgi:hypothetical protein
MNMLGLQLDDTWWLGPGCEMHTQESDKLTKQKMKAIAKRQNELLWRLGKLREKKSPMAQSADSLRMLHEKGELAAQEEAAAKAMSEDAATASGSNAE